MKKFRNLIATLFLVTMLLLPGGVLAQPAQFTADLSASEVIAEVNALRASNGLPPYEVNSILMAIAQSHAEYLASTGTMTHYSADGSRPYQRAIAAGYSVAGDLSRGGFFSENVGSAASASAIVENWQGDSLHLNTMISPDLKDVGVGVAIADGRTYYTLDAGLSTDAIVPVSSAPSTMGADPFAAPTSTSATLQPVATSTAEEDGTVHHIVQANEALWSIALAYETTIAELKRLNRLVTDDIFVGQKLIISQIEIDTPTVEPSITVTLGIPTSTATLPVTPTATFTPTPIPTPPASRQSGGAIVGGILVLALIGAAFGTWLGRRKSNG
jgi:LysM repeat protein